MKLLTNLSRILVGFVFILSGLIKMNDPLGFSFKLEEYFGSDVLNLEFLQPLALGLAVFLVILEVLLGVALLIGFRKKFTLWSLLGMIVFFTFLTFYSAYFNKVTDCGCFGDAIKLTPWESFTKDVILLVLILILFAGQRYIQPLFGVRARSVIMGMVTVASAVFSFHVIRHLPVVDFRPYKIGANITEGMSVPDDAPRPVYAYSWTFRVDGAEQVVVTKGDYPDVKGEFIGVETEEVQKGYEPPIHDFTMEKGGEDHTAFLMDEPHLLIVIARDAENTAAASFEEIKKKIMDARQKGYRVIGLSSSAAEATDRLNQKSGWDLDFYFCDLTTLKTIVRSNPGILVLEEGTIVQKLHYNDVDTLEL